jgi:hypothetical protein
MVAFYFKELLCLAQGDWRIDGGIQYLRGIDGVGNI